MNNNVLDDAEEDEGNNSSLGIIICILFLVLLFCLYIYWRRANRLQIQVKELQSKRKESNIAAIHADISNVKKILITMNQKGTLTDELESRITQLVDDIKEAHEEALEIDQTARDNFVTLKQVIEELEGEIIEKENKNALLEAANVLLEGKLKGSVSQEEIEPLRKENKSLSKQLRDMTERKNKILSNLSQLNIDHEAILQKLRNKEKEEEQIEEGLKKLKRILDSINDVHDAIDKVSELKEEEITESLRDINVRLTNALEELEGIKKQTKRLNTENELAMAAAEEEFRLLMESKDEELWKLQKRTDQLERKITKTQEQMKKKLKEKEERIKAIEGALGANVIISEMKTVLEQKESDIKERDTKIEEIQGYLENCKEISAMKQGKIDSLENRYKGRKYTLKGAGGYLTINYANSRFVLKDQKSYIFGLTEDNQLFEYVGGDYILKAEDGAAFLSSTKSQEGYLKLIYTKEKFIVDENNMILQENDKNLYWDKEVKGNARWELDEW